ncbi:MAG: NADH:flavin oxidoreductase/NADH oxidase family protein [Bacteroidota bacterium]
MSSALTSPFALPCGVVLPNRIAKAAMTERLSDRDQRPNRRHQTLYEHWSESGSGLLISGNVLVDKRYKEASGNVVIEDEQIVESLRAWVKAGTKAGNQFWAQVNHAGRQASIFSSFKPLAPSAVKLKKLGLFAKPKAMTEAEVEDAIQRYVQTALLCQKAGFTGVQIHAAHGYLMSQFLSPRTNLRTDRYGGTIEGRARALLEIVRQCREKLGPDYPLSVKINSADFQRGGFEESDAMYVIKALEELKVDLLEISGGTYENIIFLTKRYQKESTRQREAYFLDFAEKIRTQTTLPLMVTGGFRSLAFCEEVIASGKLDVIGFARPYLMDASFPQSMLDGTVERVPDAAFDFKPRMMADLAEAGYYDYQIHQLAKGKSLKPGYNPYIGLLRFTKNEMVKGWF